MRGNMRAAIAAAGTLCAAVAGAAREQDDTPMAEAVVITATREQQKLVETPAAIGVVPAATVQADKPTHPSQTLRQVPGVSVAITNGEGHTTAIRHPFTTNPVYLFLEDGIPTRSTGFFNHNALYEINVPQSDGVEVIRGPATALYGSDAIGGVINVRTRRPPEVHELYGSLEGGSHGWRRALVGGGAGYGVGGLRADLNLTHTDGWRDKTAYDRHGANLRWDHGGEQAMARTVLAWSKVDQETGANSPLVRADYENNPTRNNMPIAFRKVEAMRLSSTLEWGAGDRLLSVTPYYRHNSMDLLASFALAFDPTVYETHNDSFGIMLKWRQDLAPLRTRFIAGVDVDNSPGGREEDTLVTTPVGSGASRQWFSYSIGTRIYDYDVTYQGLSPYVHAETSPTPDLRVTAGLRYDTLRYDFDNHVALEAVQVGSNFYGQAQDTEKRFERLSPKLGATYAVNAQTHLYGSWNHGFRAPSESQLFRPSRAASLNAARAQTSSSLALQPIKARQFELGVRGQTGLAEYDLAVYDLRKSDDIVSFRDTVSNLTQSVNAGVTRHRGIELALASHLALRWRADVAVSYAKHRFEQWVAAVGSVNVDFSGKEMSSAPRLMANARLTWRPIEAARVQLEWVKLGSYWLDDANTTRYEGHALYNVRMNWQITRGLELFGSVHNITDERYADSASISSSTPVFSPGLPRTWYLGVEAAWR